MAFEGVRPVLHLPFERGSGEPILSDELRALATRMLDLDVAGWGGLQYPESLRRGARGVMPGCDLGPFSSDALRAPARTLDAEEAATLDGLFERLEAERVPGFTRRVE